MKFTTIRLIAAIISVSLAYGLMSVFFTKEDLVGTGVYLILVELVYLGFCIEDREWR